MKIIRSLLVLSVLFVATGLLGQVLSGEKINDTVYCVDSQLLVVADERVKLYPNPYQLSCEEQLSAIIRGDTVTKIDTANFIAGLFVWRWHREVYDNTYVWSQKQKNYLFGSEIVSTLPARDTWRMAGLQGGALFLFWFMLYLIFSNHLKVYDYSDLIVRHRRNRYVRRFINRFSWGVSISAIGFILWYLLPFIWSELLGGAFFWSGVYFVIEGLCHWIRLQRVPPKEVIA